MGGLHRAGLEAGMAEERAVGVPHEGADGHARGQGSQGHAFTEDGARGQDLGERRPGHTEGLAEAVVPGAGIDVHQLRPRRVADVGAVDRAARQVPEDPAVDGAHAELPGRGARLAVRGRVQQPAQLARREHGVHGQASASGDPGAVPGCSEALAETRGAAALPGHGRADGLTRGTLPGQPRLALVGDADGCQGRGARRRQALVDALADGPPDGVGVLLDPTGLRVLDGHGPCGLAHDAALPVDEDGLGVGGALVDGQDQRVTPHAGSIRCSMMLETVARPPGMVLRPGAMPDEVASVILVASEHAGFVGGRVGRTAAGPPPRDTDGARPADRLGETQGGVFLDD